MPFGTLREFKSGAARADIIIVSKCIENFTQENKNSIIQKLKPLPHQHVFFTKIKYLLPYNLLTNEIVPLQYQDIILVSGIANNGSLYNYLQQHTKSIHTLSFPDHYYYNTDDINDILETFKNLNSNNKCIVTTQKDATRLLLHKEILQLSNTTILVLPIKIEFLFNEADDFEKLIYNHLISYYPIIANTTENYETYNSENFE